VFNRDTSPFDLNRYHCVLHDKMLRLARMAPDFDIVAARRPWFVAFWLWWPKSDKGWRKFGIAAGYLLVFFLVMRFVFKC